MIKVAMLRTMGGVHKRTRLLPSNAHARLVMQGLLNPARAQTSAVSRNTFVEAKSDDRETLETRELM